MKDIKKRVRGGCYSVESKEVREKRISDRRAGIMALYHKLEHSDVESKPTIVYLIKSGRFIKIGRTYDIASRFRAIRSSCPNAKLLYYGKCLAEIETFLHGNFIHHHYDGEWFTLPKEAIEYCIETIRYSLTEDEK